jgi:MFS family permease
MTSVALTTSSPATGTVAATPAATDRAAERWLLAASFLMACASIAVFVLLPDLQAELGLSTASLGPIAAASFLAGFGAQLLLAPLADRGWEQRLLVGSLLTAAGSLIGTALATNATTLVAMRGLEGLALGAFIPATRAIVSRTAGAQIGERLGRLSAAEFAGIAIGPLVAAGIAAIWSADAALITLALVALATVPVVNRIASTIVQTRPDAPRSPARRADTPRSGLDLLASRKVWAALLLTVAVTIPVGAYDTLWARFLTDHGASTLVIGASLTVFAVPYVLLAGRAGRLSDRMGPLPAAAIGLVVMSVVIVGYGLLTNVSIIIAIGLVESTGQALAAPAAQAAASRSVPIARAGTVQGLAGAIGTLAAGLVALVAAPVYAGIGQTGLFVGTAALVLGALGLSALLSRR